MNSKELSNLTGISDRTIRDWQSKGIVPGSTALTEQGRSVPLSSYISAIVTHLRQQVEEAKSKDTESGELYQEKVRLTRAQADKVELEIAESEGELVNARETVLAWSKFILACRSRLLGMPAKLSYKLAGVTVPTLVEEILREAVDEALMELSNADFGFGLGVIEGNSDGVQASTTPDGGGLG